MAASLRVSRFDVANEQRDGIDTECNLKVV
jgi:hypothetical protein